jgi:hypothetical protein
MKGKVSKLRWYNKKWLVIYLALIAMIVIIILQIKPPDKYKKYGRDRFIEKFLDSFRTKLPKSKYDIYMIEADRSCPTEDLIKTAYDNIKLNNKNDYHKKTKRLLCVTYMKARWQSIETLMNNMIYTHNQNACDWAVIAYGGNPILMSTLQNLSHSIGVTLIYAEMAVNAKTYLKKYWKNDNIDSINQQFYPKPIMHLQLLPYIKDYEYVWMIDDDISFEGIHFNKYFDILKSGFLPYPGPLISQAPIYDNTQRYKYLNNNKWNTTITKNVKIVASKFIEVQSPLINADFFIWFVETVITPMIEVFALLGTDDGMDNIWCGAAKFYAENYLDVKANRSNSKTIDDYNSCAIVLSGESIRHFNKASSREGLNDYEFKVIHQNHRKHIAYILAMKFRPWFIFGDDEYANPFDTNKSNLKFIYDYHFLI